MFKIFTTVNLLMLIIAKLNAEQCPLKDSKYYIVRNDGPALPQEEVISSSNVQPSVQVHCNILCHKEPNCVGFNFRRESKTENCQLTYTAKGMTNTGSGDWTLFMAADVDTNQTIEMPADCEDLHKAGARQDGIYTIDPDGQGSFQVKCDMHTDGGGWTVFQEREDDSVNFYRDWKEYKNGFGSLNGNFWLGLDKIHRLTKANKNVLRVDLMDFSSRTVHAKYSDFTVAPESNSYTLNVGGFSGNAGDSLNFHNGMKFSTEERDNDKWNDGNCARDYKAGWWYAKCHRANLNGLYVPENGKATNRGLSWYRWKERHESMKKTAMKMRQNMF